MNNFLPSTLNRLNQAARLDNFRKIHNGVYLSYPRRISKANSTISPTISTKYGVGCVNEKTQCMKAADQNLEGYRNEKSKYPLLSDEYDGINLES